MVSPVHTVATKHLQYKFLITRKLRYPRKRLHWRCPVLQLLIHLIIDSVNICTTLISIGVEFPPFAETLEFLFEQNS